MRPATSTNTRHHGVLFPDGVVAWATARRHQTSGGAGAQSWEPGRCPGPPGRVQLAKLELEDKGSRLRVAGVLMGAAVAVAVFAVGVLIAAAGAGPSRSYSRLGRQPLPSGAGLVTVAGVMFLVGRAGMGSVGSLAPTETIEAAQEDVAWIRRETDRLRSTE